MERFKYRRKYLRSTVHRPRTLKMRLGGEAHCIFKAAKLSGQKVKNC